ncbi:hypothetical protein ACP4OV_009045 [Aristida adscensionis]
MAAQSAAVLLSLTGLVALAKLATTVKGAPKANCKFGGVAETMAQVSGLVVQFDSGLLPVQGYGECRRLRASDCSSGKTEEPPLPLRCPLLDVECEQHETGIIPQVAEWKFTDRNVQHNNLDGRIIRNPAWPELLRRPDHAWVGSGFGPGPKNLMLKHEPKPDPSLTPG